MNKVDIKTHQFHEGSYRRNGLKWSVTYLIEASKDLEVFEIPLNAIDIGINVWDTKYIKDFLYNYKLVNDCDLKYPILLDDTGFICDGWHRVCKAIIEGKVTIKAKRFIEMPEHTGTYEMD